VLLALLAYGDRPEVLTADVGVDARLLADVGAGVEPDLVFADRKTDTGEDARLRIAG
jgi:hypothetical protein